MATDALLKRWLLEFVQTPGLTAVTELGEAHALHVVDALTADGGDGAYEAHCLFNVRGCIDEAETGIIGVMPYRMTILV